MMVWTPQGTKSCLYFSPPPNLPVSPEHAPEYDLFCVLCLRGGEHPSFLFKVTCNHFLLWKEEGRCLLQWFAEAGEMGWFC